MRNRLRAPNGAGFCEVSPRPSDKGEGVERRKAHPLQGRLEGGGVHDADASPSGAPPRRFLFAGPRFRVGADAFAPLIQAASAALQPHRVQPFKAAPLSGGGRVPATSRVPADEAGPRAPPFPTFCSVTAERPPRGEGE